MKAPSVLVDTPAKLAELRGRLLRLRDAGWVEPVGFDVESFGPEFEHGGKRKPDFTRHRLAGYSISFVDGARYYVPLRHPEQDTGPGPAPAYDAPDLRERYVALPGAWRLLKFLELADPVVWGHNLKTEIAVVANEGFTIRCRLRDSELAAWMAGMELDGAGGLKLKPLSREYLGHVGPDFAEVSRGRQSNEIPAAELAPYAADDPWLALRLGELAYARIVELDSVAHFELEMRCIKVTEHMERTGVAVDRAYLLSEADRCEAEALMVAQAFERLTRCPVQVPVKVKRPKPCPHCSSAMNPPSVSCTADGRKVCVGGILHHRNGKPVLHTVEELGWAERGARIGSDADVSRWLYRELGWWPAEGVPEVEYGPSVKEDFIRPFAGMPGRAGEAARLRLRYQALRKYVTTYTRGLVALADQAGDGRLHTSYKQDGTDTTRYSSSMPNQSNLPRSKRQDLPWMKDLPDIRKAFVPTPGWVVVIFDFSQIEMRIMAHYSRDPNLSACYSGTSPVDVHERTRLGMEVRSGSGMKVQRGDAKITNFSTIYDISPNALARKLSLGTNDWETYTPDVAAGFIEGFFDAYPKVRRYHERSVAYAQEHGYATCLTGFKRPITGWNERRKDPKSGRSYSRYGTCKRQAINTPIQASAGGILKRALVGLYERWDAEGLLNTQVRMQGQVYDEIIVECRPEVVERVSADIKEIMEGAAPELRVPIVAEGGVGSDWSSAKS
jgi:DNA polymerase I-like protein with 3'-5' exonuclease and polymerase domains